jgi:predicted permease
VSWQVALSLVLLVCAGLLVTSFRRLATLDPGFDASGVLVVGVDWSSANLAEDRRSVFPRELVTRVRQVPGTLHTSAAILTPVHGMLWTENVISEGFADGEDEEVWLNAVSEGYLATLRQRLRAGRDFSERDGPGSAPVVIVNETLARRFFGDSDPLGRWLRVRSHDELKPPMEIVGVVGDAKYRRLDETITPTAYLPLDQSEPWGSSVQLALRARGAPSGLIPAVVDAMREVHPGLSLEFRTLSDQVAGSLARPRLLALLSAFFGVLALLLAVVGLYGTMAYDVTRRRSEIGVRIALGARRAGLLRMVAGEAGRTIALGLVLGGLLTFATTRWLSALLYDIAPLEPMVLALSALILTIAAMSAGLVPAWRAAGVDPMRALREE